MTILWKVVNPDGDILYLSDEEPYFVVLHEGKISVELEFEETEVNFFLEFLSKYNSDEEYDDGKTEIYRIGNFEVCFEDHWNTAKLLIIITEMYSYAFFVTHDQIAYLLNAVGEL